MTRRMAALAHVDYRSVFRVGADVCGGDLFVLPRVFAPEKIPNENEIKNDSIGSCGAACAGSLVLALQAAAVVA
jgi:hypothetical protein